MNLDLAKIQAAHDHLAKLEQHGRFEDALSYWQENLHLFDWDREGNFIERVNRMTHGEDD